MDKWEEIATAESDRGGTPGQAYRLCKFALYRRGERYRATAYDGRHTTQGRANHPGDAIGNMRSDVLTWAGDDVEWQARLSTAMRELAYAVEDIEYAVEDVVEDANH